MDSSYDPNGWRYCYFNPGEKNYINNTDFREKYVPWAKKTYPMFY